MWKIIVADSHSAIRNGLRKIIAGEADLQVVAEAANARELLNKVRITPAHLLLLDISLPGVMGLQLLANLRQKHPELPVLVMSMHADNEHAALILKVGAAGFIRKENISHEVVSAIREALANTNNLVAVL